MNRILILGRNSRSTRLLLTTLKNRQYDVLYIEECRKNNSQLIKRRINRFGLFKVLSQLVFQFFSKIQLKSVNVQSRLNTIEAQLVENVEEFVPICIVENINSVTSQNAIEEVSPDCIILSGTRILTPEFLSKVTCSIINIHAGITPAFRGVHGGYWALALNKPDLFGATIHLVDEGIDTGAVIAHATTEPTPSDNFSTYPLLQMSAALKVLPEVLDRLLKNKSETFTPKLDSSIWSHPTIWQYIYYRLMHGVK